MCQAAVCMAGFFELGLLNLQVYAIIFAQSL